MFDCGGAGDSPLDWLVRDLNGFADHPIYRRSRLSITFGRDNFTSGDVVELAVKLDQVLCLRHGL